MLGPPPPPYQVAQPVPQGRSLCLQAPDRLLSKGLKHRDEAGGAVSLPGA